jgi:magnesium-protoporphyrin O-methyltransferase
MGGCCGDGLPGFDKVFDERTARRELDAYRRKGAAWSTRELIDELAEGIDLQGASVIDIGAGVGAVHLALLERGADRATDVDGSRAYLATAREEAARRGVGDRVTHVLGDATRVAAELEPAALVALDRVVCCFADLDGLLAAATSLSSRRVGLVYPRDQWWLRALEPVANPILFARSRGYRFHIHRKARVDALLGQAGFARIAERTGFWWRIETWERRGVTSA